MSNRELAETFRRLHHQPEPLVLINAWDAGSARVVESAGAAAIATTSAGVSWALGRQDGHGMTRRQAIDALRPVMSAVRLPVTVDIESGYGRGTPADVTQTVEAIWQLGAVGINLEDSPGIDGAPLRGAEAQAERIRAARDVDPGLFINARTDVYLASVGRAEERVDHVVQRAEAYLKAGADCIFVPGLTDLETLQTLVDRIDAPLNVMANPQAPPIPQLASVGVKRVSIGPWATLGAYGNLLETTRKTLKHGVVDEPPGDLSYVSLNRMFDRD